MHPLSVPLLTILPLLAPPPEGWLGVYLAADRAEAVVAEVIPGSPAAQAGLLAGDVLVAVGDTATPTVEEFLKSIRANSAGSKVTLKIRRHDRETLVEVKLGERPEAGKVVAPKRSVTSSKERPAQPGLEGQPGPGYLGLRVQESGDGLVVAEVLPGSPAQRAGVQVGERLLRLGGQPVRTLAELDPQLGSRHAGDTVELELRGKAGVRSLLVELGRRGGDQEPSKHAVPEPAAPPVVPPPDATSDLARQVRELREELRQLRQQLEELRRANRRE